MRARYLLHAASWCSAACWPSKLEPQPSQCQALSVPLPSGSVDSLPSAASPAAAAVAPTVTTAPLWHPPSSTASSLLRCCFSEFQQRVHKNRLMCLPSEASHLNSSEASSVQGSPWKVQQVHMHCWSGSKLTPCVKGVQLGGRLLLNAPSWRSGPGGCSCSCVFCFFRDGFSVGETPAFATAGRRLGAFSTARSRFASSVAAFSAISSAIRSLCSFTHAARHRSSSSWVGDRWHT